MSQSSKEEISKSMRGRLNRLASKSTKAERRIYQDADADIAPFALNIPQMVFLHAVRNYSLSGISFEGGRGVGKTTAEGILISEVVSRMPRSKWIIFSPSYAKFLQDEVPAMKFSLEMLGLFEGLHYFIGRMAPKSMNFAMPYQAPDEWKYCIHFYSGTVFQILSQEKSDVAVGLNTDGLIVTEAVYCNIDTLERKVFPTIRGTNVKAFENCNLFGLKSFFSSTNIDIKGAWFTNFEQVARMYPKEWVHIKAPTTANLENLKKGYLAEARKVSQNEVLFNAEYLCIRPPLTEDAFYNMLQQDVHTYVNLGQTSIQINCRYDQDCLPEIPLCLGVDFGAVINSAVMCQNIPGIFTVLKDFYVLGDDNKTQDDLADMIHDYYCHRENKIIYFFHDATGNNRTGNTKQTKAIQFANYLRNKGWIVIMMTRGVLNPDHEAKHLLFQKICDESNTLYPNLRINRISAKNVLLSMQNAKVKRSVSNKIQKDKTSERKLSKRNRVLATDLSDALDYVIYPLFSSILLRRQSSMAGS
jgi:hypothetical protein